MSGSFGKELSRTFNGRDVLITGHTGFKGGWLALWLSLSGANVTGYALPPNTEPNLFEAIGLKNRVNHIVGDVRDADLLRDTVRSCRPSIIFHLAAQPLVRLSYEEPRDTFETNVMGTVNLLEAARKCGSVKAILNITSDKCYENKEDPKGYREDDRIGGYDPYSCSKGCCELVSSTYRSSFLDAEGISMATARCGNVIGGGDWQIDRILPDCMRAFSKGEELIIRMPSAKRPWLHVLDSLAGYLRLSMRLLDGEADYAEPWNFAPPSQNVVAVEDVVKKAIEAWGSGSYSVESEGIPHETELLLLDASKANNRLGWTPIFDIDESIRQTVSWYSRFYSAETSSLADLSIAQIEDYIVRTGG